MSFGAFLENSVGSELHRLELDNGQMRRLAGETTTAGFGQEQTLLARALHTALAPDMIFGFAEQTPALLDRLSKERPDLAPASSPSVPDTTESKDYEKALAKLTKDQRQIHEAFTAWDRYIYDVCSAVLFPPS